MSVIHHLTPGRSFAFLLGLNELIGYDFVHAEGFGTAATHTSALAIPPQRY